jgi:hypothetical protein
MAWRTSSPTRNWRCEPPGVLMSRCDFLRVIKKFSAVIVREGGRSSPAREELDTPRSRGMTVVVTGERFAQI